MSLVAFEEVPLAKSFISQSPTFSARPAASHAIPAPLMPPPTTNRSSGGPAIPFMGRDIARLTAWRADRKRPHGLPAQDRNLRRRGLRRVGNRASLVWSAGWRTAEGTAACQARASGWGIAPAGDRRGAAVPGLHRLRVGRGCKMRPLRLSPARLTGQGAVPILPHRKNSLKWRKYKAF